MQYDNNTPANPRFKKPNVFRIYPKNVKTARTEPNPIVVQWFRLETTVYDRSVILN